MSEEISKFLKTLVEEVVSYRFKSEGKKTVESFIDKFFSSYGGPIQTEVQHYADELLKTTFKDQLHAEVVAGLERLGLDRIADNIIANYFESK